ncbi:MAG: MFS transporter [Rhodospirillales bacterium]|nr:MFS transporter [Rhodospirillales bacterium]
MATLAAGNARDYKIIGLISFGHLLSHFYFLVLPPILPLMKAEFDVSYAALGLIMTAYGLAAGIAQTPIGFLIDHIGGRPSLVVGMAIQGGTIALMGFATEFWQLLLFYSISGLANTVYHPADYAILSASIPKEKLGRAFSIHLFSGNFGWALTPGIMVGLTLLWDWRTAFIIVGLVGIVHAVIVGCQGRLLDDDIKARRTRIADRQRETEKTGITGQGSDGSMSGVRLLFTLPILMGFLFFATMTLGFTGLRGFFVAAIDLLYATPLETANLALTGFLLGSALGILAGGVLADSWGPRVDTAFITLLIAAGLVILMGMTKLPLIILIAVFSMSGFLQGILLPTRDLLIRSVTPEGSMGKVMGFLSSATMLSSAAVPPLFGWLLDIADPNWVFWLSAVFIMGALFSFVTAKGTSRAVS